MIEAVLTGIVLLVGIAFVTFMYIRRKRERPDTVEQEKLTFDGLLTIVKSSLADIVKDEYYFGKSDLVWDEAYKRKKRIQHAMKYCIYGIDADKIIVRDLISDIVKKQLPTEEDISQIIDFSSSFIEPLVKWEILMYFLKKKHGKNALPYIIKTYKWDRVVYDIEDGTVPLHAVGEEDLEFVYREEIGNHVLSYREQLDVLSIIVFTKYKGFGCIDTLREQNIDGINCGVSGSILSSTLEVGSEKPRAPRSVWVYSAGKYIHFRFLTFYTEEELRRVVLLVCMYNNPGPLTEKRGFMINTMFDKSRVLAIRPGAGEYWSLFVRKFNISNVNLDKLYVIGDDEVNARLAITMVKFLMRSMVTTAFTGRQGSGKTTMMIGAFQYLDARYNIRVLETAPEMYLRERYPGRNIYSASETIYNSMESLQDAIKKADGGISIIGEVATNMIAARMIQLGQNASEVTFFSHHAKRTQDLVYSLRNSLVEAGSLNNPITAEQQVVDVVHVDVHVDFDVDGFRYIDRITEIIKLDEGIPYPVYDPEKPVDSINEITREYYYRQTDRTCFKTQDILVFNKKTRKYETREWFTNGLTEEMLKRLPVNYREEFKDFVMKNWKV